MTEIYVDADACPVREEIYGVATRLGVQVYVVSNGSRPIRPPGLPNVRMVVVEAGADIADDWIAERITSADVCVTSDIPLASRCLARLSPAGEDRLLARRGPDRRSNSRFSALARRPSRSAHATLRASRCVAVLR